MDIETKMNLYINQVAEQIHEIIDKAFSKSETAEKMYHAFYSGVGILTCMIMQYSTEKEKERNYEDIKKIINMILDKQLKDCKSIDKEQFINENL